MSTHANLGVLIGDSIVGCYVHMDGYPEHMEGAIGDYVSIYTTTNLVMLIKRAQQCGGMRSFHATDFEDIDDTGKRTTQLLDDSSPYIIDEINWDEDHMGSGYHYLIDYNTGEIKVSNDYE